MTVKKLAILVLAVLPFLTSCKEASPPENAAAPRAASGPAAYIADVPHVDWQGLDRVGQLRATRIMNKYKCGCGRMSIAQCRRDDPACPHGPALAKRIIAALQAGESDAQASRDLSPLEAAGAPAAVIERLRLDLKNAPSIGPAGAPVTLVELIDYQCPFCQKAHATVEQVRLRYGDKVRFVFKQEPLRIHPEAHLASQAVLAAAAQGKFQKMHSRLLEQRGHLKRDDLLSAAKAVGLDVPRFTAALDSGRFTAEVDADLAQAAKIGANSTPFFFINGRPLRGAAPMPELEKLIEAELAGTLAPTRFIETVPPIPEMEPAPVEDPEKVYSFDLSGALSTGPKSAPITLVEFTDYQCPFCARLHETLGQLLAAYPGKIRMVSKNLPLNIHPRAVPAALAALAAAKQGRFWEYRHVLFTRQSALDDLGFLNYARELGLNATRFEADLADAADLQATVDRDMKEAAEAGIRSTPTFFVNGKKFSGALTLDELKSVIDGILASPAGK